MSLYLGCPIWSFKGWVGNFYPKGTKPADFLREYARRLTAIEGNTTFYAIPSQKTIEGWVAETPETFRFCPKIPKTISHAGNLSKHVDEAAGFIRVISQLGSRLGPMFLQLPPSYSPRLMEDLKTFLEAWPRGFRLGVEVRHLDWFKLVPARKAQSTSRRSQHGARGDRHPSDPQFGGGCLDQRQRLRKPAGGARTKARCAGLRGAHHRLHIPALHRPPRVGAEPTFSGGMGPSSLRAIVGGG